MAGLLGGLFIPGLENVDLELPHFGKSSLIDSKVKEGLEEHEK
jgi:hypothetical protein